MIISNKQVISGKNLKFGVSSGFDSPVELEEKNEDIDILKAEGGDHFYKYVVSLGLAKNQNLMVLSSVHHYYYDPEEMSNFETVINIKELNKIKDLKTFLHSCLSNLPKESSFIGCFIDNEKINGYELNTRSLVDNRRSNEAVENGIISSYPFINMLYSLMDSRVYTYMSVKGTTDLLKEFGFKIIDMTEYKGLTLFHSQKTKRSYN
jgi:hypothetical protein